MQHKKVIIILKRKNMGLFYECNSFHFYERKKIYETTVNETEFFFIYKEK